MPKPSKLTRSQTKSYGPVEIDYYDKPHTIKATVRFDDQCNNGHNTLSITGEIRTPLGRHESGGCLHDAIARAFPELAPLIRWHLFSTNGPMHGNANALYLAGERDCWGGLKGETRSREYYVEVEDGALLVEWPKKEHRIFGPKVKKFKSRQEANAHMVERCIYGHVREHVTMLHEGKERELDAARTAASWPEATDEELTAPGLKGRLEARASLLMELFRRDVESLGFVW